MTTTTFSERYAAFKTEFMGTGYSPERDIDISDVPYHELDGEWPAHESPWSLVMPWDVASGSYTYED